MNKAIIHIDGDSFFAACEIALDPKLKGRPVVTGQERGIATAMSKEAKALGIHRGMPVYQIRKLYPQVVIVNSNYHSYGIFAQRMYTIVRRYSDDVEEYSIDECFGLLRQGFEGQADIIKTAGLIKKALQDDLGITFSVGLAPTKVLAKVASKWNKPDGFTVIEPESISNFLKEMEIGKVWGIGPQTSHALQRMGVKTALNFIEKPERWVKAELASPMLATWYELRGKTVYSVHSGPEEDQASIQKTRSFTPPSTDKDFLFSELSKNVESACARARSQKLTPRKIYYFLKTQEFRYHRFEISLVAPTQEPNELLEHIKATFNAVYRPRTLYRSTGVTLGSLVPQLAIQNDLFGEVLEKRSWRGVFKTVDTIDRRYGSRSVVLGSSLKALTRRRDRPERHLDIPYMGEVA